MAPSQAFTLTPESIKYQLAHYNENRGPMTQKLSLAISILTTLVVILRFAGRRTTGAKIKADDYMVLLALISIWTMTGSYLFAIKEGFGYHTIRIPLQNVVPALKTTFVASIAYVFAISSVKISILLLYRRIFSTGRFWIYNSLMGAFVVGCFFAGLFTVIFRCNPVSGAWDVFSPTRKCIETAASTISQAGLNIASDLLILVMPLPLVYKLHVSRARKIMISMTFLLGVLACVASMIRIKYTIIIASNSVDFYDLNGFAILSLVEPCLATMCCCFVVARPLVKMYIVGPISTYRSTFQSGSRSRSGGNTSGTPKVGRWPKSPPQDPWSANSTTMNNSTLDESVDYPTNKEDVELTSPPAAPRAAKAWQSFMPHKDSRFVNATTVDNETYAELEEDEIQKAGGSRIRVRNDVEWSSVHTPDKK